MESRRCLVCHLVFEWGAVATQRLPELRILFTTVAVLRPHDLRGQSTNALPVRPEQSMGFVLMHLFLHRCVRACWHLCVRWVCCLHAVMYDV